ncbi:alpha/beta fold hydrolase [Nocardioides sp. SYSU D00038]|uniref:alpha/beta fold hydrolase n=1 Tax=Nocardioides sp. SYSU D00038 TaxID=2812554 RepID=UPI001967EB9A|nr:alpha/beta fold hydrolase [Nocardioides sp. SYSU D00038]
MPRGALRRLGTALGVLALAGIATTAGPIAAAADEDDGEDRRDGVEVVERRVAVGPEADGTPVELDTSLYTPAGDGPHPAVLLTHGFGGSKADLAPQARELAESGYVALTYSARGFGDSDGRVHVADPGYEGRDVTALLDLLADDDAVRQDADGDPRVAAVGGSYGGALSLIGAALDRRIDTVVALITWHDLADAFFPQHAVAGPPADGDSPADLPVVRDGEPVPGPFKQLWASRFFVGAAGGDLGPGTDPVCGRFDREVCRLFLDVADTGRPSPALLRLLRAHSPAPLLDDVRVPTYLVQGQADSLFGLDQSDATARELAARGTPVAVRWFTGGHDAAVDPTAADDDTLATWLDHYLGADDPAAVGLPVPAFSFEEPRDGRADLRVSEADDYAASWSAPLPLRGGGQVVLNPLGGQPGSLTLVPSQDGVTDEFDGFVSTYPLAALPGQSAAFDTDELDDGRTVVGSPRVRLTVTSTAREATLFLSLWEVNGDRVTLPRQLVAPVTVPTTPGRAATVDVALPAGTWRVEPGSSLRVLVTSTDQTYAGPRQARADRVRVDDLRLPAVVARSVAGTGDGGLDRQTTGVLAALGAVLLAALVLALLRRRGARHADPDPDPHPAPGPGGAPGAGADVPLVVSGLVKTYADGHRAVDDVSWEARRGQVVGLLGPNGAGKTTTLRMVLGLIAPDIGEARVLGRRVTPGAAVLARVGALVEGPGFLPHLSGRQNLEAFWAATGRDPAEAGYDDVLEVAALGGAIDRPVRTYSQGMRQRLGIAQAMLGRPEVLVLDEPTNGLDPPQIAGLRPILQRYADTGRTVVVSSHLLSEVELTCSHVVVMHAGRVVTTGPVSDLVDSADTTVLTLAAGADPEPPAAALRAVAGVDEVEVVADPAEPRLVVTAGLPRPDVVRAAAATGADVVGVSSRRHLEEVFLGVIAAASGDRADSPADLRQVRAR